MDTQSVQRPILAYSRIDGRPVALVPSQSQANLYHIVTESSCSCKGFSYRHRCRHLAPATRTSTQPLVARLQA